MPWTIDTFTCDARSNQDILHRRGQFADLADCGGAKIVVSRTIGLDYRRLLRGKSSGMDGVNFMLRLIVINIS
jgi:hypothetical protein